MTDPMDLINKLAREEQELMKRRFLAPYFPGYGRVRVRVAGLVYQFRTDPRDKVGVGIFRPVSADRAEFMQEASPEEAEHYITCFPLARATTVFFETFWYALPVDLAAARKIGFEALVPVVEYEGFARDRIAGAFEYIEGHFDGARLWLKHLDPRADPFKTEELRKQTDRESAMQLKGLTPEDRAAIAIAFARKEAQMRLMLDCQIRIVLGARGARLESMREFSDGRIEVVWRSRSSHVYRTIVRRQDLSVVSAGICLSGEDRQFDLSSLVGVVHEGEQDDAIVQQEL